MTSGLCSISLFSDRRTKEHIIPCPYFCLYAWCLCSCDRRDLTYSDEAEITITADWSKTGLSKLEGQYGATAVFYPIGGR